MGVQPPHVRRQRSGDEVKRGEGVQGGRQWPTTTRSDRRCWGSSAVTLPRQHLEVPFQSGDGDGDGGEDGALALASALCRCRVGAHGHLPPLPERRHPIVRTHQVTHLRTSQTGTTLCSRDQCNHPVRGACSSFCTAHHPHVAMESPDRLLQDLGLGHHYCPGQRESP